MKRKITRFTVTAIMILIISGIIGLTNAGSYYLQLAENEIIKNIKEKFALYNEEFPEDRVYLQFDKPFYQPGETIFFGAYIRNGVDLKPSLKSDILHVEFIGPKGNIEKEIKIIAKNGKAVGDFTLDENAPGGMYKVKAYTNWQKNETDTIFFEKELQVQNIVLPNLKMKLDFEKKAFGMGDEVIAKLELNTNENKPLANQNFKYVVNLDGSKFIEKPFSTDEEGLAFIKFNLPKSLKTSDGLLNVMIDYQGNTESVSRSIPIVLNKIKLALYPEGGDLVNGIECNVAFRAINEFDKPADVEGLVYDKNDQVVGTFSSFHQGMGSFKLKPEPGQNYYVQVTKPKGIEDKFELPEALARGYVISTENTKFNELTLHVKTTENEELSVVAQVRGQIYYANAIKAVKGDNLFVIPTDEFPAGVTQITLFDSKGIPRSERLAFVNKTSQLNISIQTDKEKYLPREKVKLTINVKDDRGMPIPANLSLSVVNDQLLSFADDKSGNILSKLLLEQDIKEKVEEPAFYFSDDPKSDKALDYLLMTAGWRRYTWEQVLNEELPPLAFNGEKAVITGTLLDAYTSKPITDATVKISGKWMLVHTNSKGFFTLKNVDLSEPAVLYASANGYTNLSQNIADYTQNQVYYMYSQNYYGYNNQIDDWGNGGGNKKFANVPQAPNLAGGNNIDVERNEVDKIKTKTPVYKKLEKPDVVNNIVVPKENKPEVKDQPNIVNLDAKVKDNRLMDFDMEKEPLVNNQVTYYRAKKFAAPLYNKQEKVEVRTDFRNTIFWDGSVDIDKTGKKVIEFYNSDDISSFRINVEGISTFGLVGRMEKNFFTQLPFAMSTKIPVEVVTEDIVSIPLTLKNNTLNTVTGTLTIKSPAGLKTITPITLDHSIAAGKTKTIYLDYKVLNTPGVGEFEISFNSEGLSDAFVQKIKICSKGFPVTASFAGKDGQRDYFANIANPVDGSITASLTAYPTVVSDLLKGIESILREPYGCFEQTSMSSYPNVMVMDYLKTTESKDDKLIEKCKSLLDNGYKKLLTFEAKDKGYEWFGGSPAHEALTAYGLMQFNDMKEVYKVDQTMIDRTAKWLMDKKDGNGGFVRNPRALDQFGGANEDITAAYIVYALAEAGYNDIKKEYEKSYKDVLNSKDPYVLGLIGNASFKLKELKNGEKIMELIYASQKEDGSWTGNIHSITRSTGLSLTIETTSLALMAIMKSPNQKFEALTKGVEYLVKSRSGYGAFGSTQGTILALKALTEYAKQSKSVKEDGILEFYVDGKKVAEKPYKAGDKDAITIDSLQKYIGAGKHDFKIKFAGTKNPLPYSFALGWNTFMPNSSKECLVDLKTTLAAKTANVGETVRLSIVLKNKTDEGQPSTIAIIGIPAGMTAQPWQLKEILEKKIVDYYEVVGSNIVLYYRQMAPSEVKEINLDLKAEIPGEYQAPASSAYLYYTNEFKCWTAMDKITIKKGTF
jgi:hypothetical protein